MPSSGVVLVRHASAVQWADRHSITANFHFPIRAPTPRSRCFFAIVLIQCVSDSPFVLGKLSNAETADGLDVDIPRARIPRDLVEDRSQPVPTGFIQHRRVRDAAGEVATIILMRVAILRLGSMSDAVG